MDQGSEHCTGGGDQNHPQQEVQKFHWGQIIFFKTLEKLELPFVTKAERTEVHDIVQEAVIKTIPKGKKFKKAKWLSDEALQIAEKRREMKGTGEKESYSKER